MAITRSFYILEILYKIRVEPSVETPVGHGPADGPDRNR